MPSELSNYALKKGSKIKIKEEENKLIRTFLKNEIRKRDASFKMQLEVMVAIEIKVEIEAMTSMRQGFLESYLKEKLVGEGWI